MTLSSLTLEPGWQVPSLVPALWTQSGSRRTAKAMSKLIRKKQELVICALEWRDGGINTLYDECNLYVNFFLIVRGL